MTTSTDNSPTFVLTPAGSRIPKTGSLAYHPNIGFAEVVGRVGERVRLLVTDFSEATDVALASGTISRQAWMKRLADVSETVALAEIDHLEARLADPLDAFYGASALVKQFSESAITRTRGANEMLVSLDAPAGLDWEFDEYLVERPKVERKRGKAPAPRPYQAPASKVGTLEDPSKPDWLVAEMNECFGDTWQPSA
jgi:hypothetical protein